MPSPFPGMDPYLEDPSHWGNVHHGLMSACQELLNRQLRPRYVATVEERVYLSPEDDPGRRLVRVPDLRIERPPGRREPATPAPEPAPLAGSLLVTTLDEEEVRAYRLEIIAVDTRTTVTVLEIVSPTNKHPGSEGRKDFLQKRREVTGSDLHWVEIDLLRAGDGLAVRRRLPPHEYFVHVSPAHLRPKGRVWPVRLKDSLPTVAIPLRKGDAAASLDLQEALTLAYDRGAYDVNADYTSDPVPPLPSDLAAWADELLRARGLR